MEEFNRDLGYWLLDQRDNLKEMKQKNIFDLAICEEDDTEVTQHNILLIKKIAEQYTKLSFLIKENPQFFEVLTNYLTHSA